MIVVLIEVEVFGGDVIQGSDSKGGGSHGEAFRTDGVDDGALGGSKFSLVCWADAAGVSGVNDLALISLALRLVAVGSPPIFLTDCLALLILLVSVGAITFLVVLICPPKSRQIVTTGTLAF